MGIIFIFIYLVTDLGTYFCREENREKRKEKEKKSVLQKMATGLVNSFLAAIQASLSVLLVISYGGLAAHLQLLTPTNTKAISKVCVRMFLPALLVTKIGGELHAGSAGRYLTVLVWAVACHLVSFLVGVMAHLWLGMPDWTTVAVMFNNTTSYPLLLIAALEQTGILKSLIPSDGGDHGETTSQAVERAKSYFLVFATVSSCLTFAVGPRLIDTEHAADSNDEDDDEEEEPEEDKDDIRDDDDDDDDENQNNVDGLLYHHQSGGVGGVGGVGVGSMSTSIVSSRGGSIGGGEDSTERTRLLSRRTSTFSLTKKRQNSFFPSTRTTSIIDWTDDDENSPQSQGQIDTDLLKRRPTMVPVPRRRWIKLTPRTRWWLLFISDFFNAPLLGAILGAFIGLIPPLHRAFFNDTEHGGIFTAWLTSSWQSIGGLFVPLPVVVAV